MPFYEYQCSDCGHELEALQKISDPALTDCPKCGAAKLRKRISKSAFRLKGSGWYETDFKNPKKATKKESKGEKPTANKDAKPKTKTTND